MPNPPVLPDYAELQCITNHTFLLGASHPEELVIRARELGYAALAIADECSMAGIVRAHIEAERQAIKLIAGTQFLLHDDQGRPALRLIALAQTRDGYGNLCELITLGRRRADKGSYYLMLSDLTAPTEPGYGHLLSLPDCLILLVPPHAADTRIMDEQAQWVAAHFPNRAWLALTLLHRPLDQRHKQTVLDAARRAGLPVAATGDVRMHVRTRKPLHDTLTAIHARKPIAECGLERRPNAEQHLRSRLQLANLYPADALAQTVRIARLCPFELGEIRYEYPDEICPAGHTPASYLRQETYRGAHARFPGGLPGSVQAQIEHELALIASLNYEAYFLTVYDIVRFARQRHILCQGRGSAANSAVCYCLGITAVDPARGNNLFERFISRERDEPPDIDVDFEHHRREEVIQYIYRKYGRDRAALTAVVISYRVKSTLRDIGKALGVDPDIVEAVAASYRHWDGRSNLIARLAECGLDPDSPTARHWVRLAETLLGFPRHLSQHPGGFVISRGPLRRLVPIENAAMPGRSVVQWDKDDLDAMKLLKVDVLSLGMLTALRRALDMVAQRKGHAFGLEDIPHEDGKTYDMICAADTIGVFQIESRAQMTMLPRLRPRAYYDLVIEVAIVRPGPIQGGMVHPYLERRKDPSRVAYPSPALEKVLKRTLGIPIFQEQVMQIAMVAAGFSAGQADELRRSMAAWKRKGGLGKYYDKIISGMTQRGYDESFAIQIFRQIEGFGEYGFPESHAASFALLAYASSWLKRHEPAAFLAALLNSQPMGFYSAYTLIQDAQRHGVVVLPVDVMLSDYDARLEPIEPQGAVAVRLGMNRIKSLGRDGALRIEQARRQRPFTDMTDLARRARLSRHDMNALAGANALRALADSRRQALWHAAACAPGKGLLRDADQHDTDAPALPPATVAEELVADYRAMRLTLGPHPVGLLRERLRGLRFASSQELDAYPSGRIARACGIVTVRQRPGTAKGVTFVTLEDETGVVNLIVRPAIAQRQRRELVSSRLLGAYGSWQSQHGVRHLIAGRLVDLTALLGELAPRSRDFQ